MKVTTVERMVWTDPVIADVPVPTGKLTLRSGFGSGLARRPSDPADTFWAIGDRGPNLKVAAAIKRYGLVHLEPLRNVAGAKVMPRPDIGPAIAQFRIVGDEVELVRELRLTTEDGMPISGLAHPGSDALLSEPVFDLFGAPLAPDPQGMDTEGLVAMSDGSFWVGDEFGPALVRFDIDGHMVLRLLPGSSDPTGADARGLPILAARRQLNRGFEALAVSPDESCLILAFQSPLAHPDEAAHRHGRHVRLWRVSLPTGRVVAQYAYPLEPESAFHRDTAKGSFDRSDIKVSELVWLPGGDLLVLERGSETTKVYRCTVDTTQVLGAEHLDIAHRPTLEELSASSEPFPLTTLTKSLILDTDDHPEISADLEGMVLLAANQLLLVNDNDFGVEGAETAFWRITFDRPL